MCNLAFPSVRPSIHRPFNSQEALDKAKKAVEENYAVVGVLEDLNTTLTVLEHYVPRFFRGVSQVYHGMYCNVIFMSY